jgi:hypothetical protein
MIQQIKHAAGPWLNACSVPSRVTVFLLVMAAAANGAVVDFRLTALTAPSESDTTATVPASQPTFALGSSIFLEVWVQTAISNGVSSASSDLSFNSSLTTAAGVTYSSIFSTLTHSSINNPSGVVDDLSGSHLGPCTDAIGVAPNWARVAVVEFTADANGPLTIQAVATGSPVYGTAICGLGDVDPANISFDSVTVTLGDAAIPAASTWGLAAMSLLILVAGTIALRRVGASRELATLSGR